MTVLEAVGLVAGYEPGLPIVKGVSIDATAGEIVALLGPNGAGKSTLIKAVAGLVPLEAGTVRLSGQAIGNEPAHRMVRRGMAYVPQTENVFLRMSVEDNLILGGAFLARRERRARIDELLAFFPDLARQRRLLAGRLSGGQRQMLAIARALIVSPRVLLLDEPSAGLSPGLVEAVLGRLRAIADNGVAMLLVEQNVRAALGVAHRACILVDGHLVHAGPAAEMSDTERLHALFLGGRPH